MKCRQRNLDRNGRGFEEMTDSRPNHRKNKKRQRCGCGYPHERVSGGRGGGRGPSRVVGLKIIGELRLRKLGGDGGGAARGRKNCGRHIPLILSIVGNRGICGRKAYTVELESRG